MEIQPAVLDWLLEENNPSMRYRTLTGLLDRAPEDAQVLEARALISCSPTVQQIFAHMHPDGYWLWNGRGANVDYAMSSSTHFVLSFLAELGLDRSDERIERAVERYLSLTLPDMPDPSPWQIPPDYRNHQSCLYAFNLRTFVMQGYRDDPRIQERVEVLLANTRLDGGYLCDRTSFRPKTKSCIRGSQKALMAFAELPELWHTSRCQQLVDYFLRRRLLFRMKHPDQIVRPEVTHIGFPFVIQSTLLESLYPLSKMGYGGYPELEPAWALLEAKRTSDGRWPLEGTPKTFFNAGKEGEANKWVTLYALMAIKYRQAVAL